MAARPCEYTSLPDWQQQEHQAQQCCPATTHNQQIEEHQNKSSPYFGDHPGRVEDNTFRLASINVNRLSPYRGDAKDERFFGDIEAYDLNIIALQEHGVNWSLTDSDNQLQNRLNTYFLRGQTSCFLSHNSRDQNKNQHQYGGTGIIARGKIKAHAMGAGSDRAKLGRWTWARYSGKGGMVLRVVSLYQPCENKNGATSVWSQQKRYLQEQNDDRDPRTAFRQDLKQEIQEWITMGDSIVFGGDVNESIHHHTIKDIFAEFNIRHLIFGRHDPTNAPRTYARSADGHIVDGIWGTPGIDITAGGYLEPADFTGDHSLLWVDITYNSALGHNPPKSQNPDARRLQTWNTKCMNKYLDKYEEYVAKDKLSHRIFRLEANTPYGVYPIPDQCQEAEAIDHLKTKHMLKAETKCRKLRMGQVDFSEATDGPVKRIDFWETAIKRRRGMTCHPSTWDRKKAKAGIQEHIRTLSIQDMIERLKAARQDYRKAKKDHEKERVSFLDTLSPKDRDKLKRKEEQRKLGRAAKRVTGKLASKSVTKIIVDGQECNSKVDIEAALLPINLNKVQASNDTPCLQEPLRSQFGPRNNTENAEKVLSGTYTPPPSTDQYTTAMFSGLKQPEQLLNGSPSFKPRSRISTDDHVKGWNKASERTSAGMSQIHFGMYKAQAKRRHLADMDAALRSFAYSTGYSFKRWKKGLDVQLLKRSQDFRAEKLRTILLLEADFNMNNKTLGRDAMKSGESLGALTRDNYGGRNHHRAAEVSLNSHLTNNSIWARRGRAIIMSNDAKGCYDRIAHIVVDLALRRLGIPKPAMQSMLETIQEMEHHIRTAFGDSEGFYGSDPNGNPNQGILQGNGAGPAGWSAISSVIIDEMKKAGFGYKQWSVIRKRATTIVCFAFVDDTDLIHANDDPEVSTDELIDEAQVALATWEGLIRASGGALAPEKSYWYLIEVERKRGKWRYKKISDQPGDLYLQNGHHRNLRLEVSSAREALGIMTRPDGKMKDEFEHLRSKVIQWCDAIRTKRVKPSEAWYCLTATIMKTIEYPLIATTFTRKQIDKIMKPLWKTALNLCQIQKKLPRKLIYGTLKARGLGLKDPFLLQLIFHLQTILRHTHRDTPTHDLIDENMDLVQLHVGSKQPFWDLPFELYGPLAPDGWIKFTWEALWDTPLSMKGPTIATPTLRQHDVHLTDAFIEQGFEDHELIQLQDCRLYLKATTLAHITTACGSRIEDRAWQGKQSIQQHPPQWINTHNPGYRQWNLWRRALRACFLPHDQETTRLKQPLGPWHAHAEDKWIWWKHTASPTLYQLLQDGSWCKWEQAPLRNFRSKYHNPTPMDSTDVPANIQRASVAQPKRSQYTTIVNTSPIQHQLPQQPTLTTLASRLKALPESAHWALNPLNYTDEGAYVAQQILTHTAIAVGDGSLKMGLGTAGFTLRGETDDNKVEGANKVPGPIAEGDSHRCEVAGLCSIVLLANAICEHHNILSGSITVACDNTHALRLFSEDYVPEPQHLNFDLVSATWNLARASPIKWIPKHVKGHQDDHKNYHSLPRLAQINVQMDTLAKTYWQTLVTDPTVPSIPTPKHHTIHGEEWQLWCGSTKINSPTVNQIYDIIQTPITQQWWIRHNHSSKEAQELTDWTATDQFMHSIPINRRRYVTKTASANCGVGTTLVTWKHQDHATCPRCNQTKEDTDHIHKCDGYGADEEWEKGLTSVRTYLEKTLTKPSITDAFIHCLQRWHISRNIQLFDFDHDIRVAIRQQHKIGWQDLLHGLSAKEWQRLQRTHYKEQGIRKSSRRWIKGLLIQLHHLSFRMWDHRNTIKHKVRKPQEKLMEDRLNRVILRHLTSTPTSLLPSDRYHLRHNAPLLLKKPVAFKKAWLLNVLAACTRALRIRTNDPEADAVSTDEYPLLRWINKYKDPDED